LRRAPRAKSAEKQATEQALVGDSTSHFKNTSVAIEVNKILCLGTFAYYWTQRSAILPWRDQTSGGAGYESSSHHQYLVYAWLCQQAINLILHPAPSLWI